MKTMPRLKRFGSALVLASLCALSANAFAATVTSVANGGWNNPATWDTGVPVATDDVVIGVGTTVTINTTPITIGSLRVEGLLEYDATVRSLTVTTNLSISPGGILQTNPVGVQTGHNLIVGGNLTNDGTLDLSTSSNTSGARLTFTGAASRTFSGTGPTTDLRTLTINKGTSNANILEIATSVLSVQGTVVDGAPMAFLTITNGTLKISGTFPMAGRTSSGGLFIPATGGFWLNNPNYIVSGQAGNGTVNGLLRISQGTLNVGTAANNSIAFGNNAVVTVEGGAINVTGRFGVGAPTNNLAYTQTGGVITVCTISNNSATLASFDLGQGLGPDVDMSGGTVIIRNSSSGVPARDYRNQQGNTALGISNTVLQFGDAGSGAAKTFNVEGLLPNVVVSNASAGHTVLFRPPTSFANSALDLTINAGCTFNIGNNTYLQRGSTVTNNGTLTATGPWSRFVWFPAGGNGVYQGFGTSTGVLTSWETQMANLTMSQVSPLVARRIIIFDGNILNSDRLTLGDGSATVNLVQIGNTTTPTAAGAFDVAPTFNLGTGGEHIAYLRTTASSSTGSEIPPGRTLVSLWYDDNDATHALTIAGGDLTVSGTTALTNGRIITGANKLVANGVVTRTAGYVDGFLQKPVTAGDAVAQTFEVGDALAYSPIDVTFASVTGAGALIGKATGGDHPQIASANLVPNRSVNRNWTLTNSGTTFTTADAVFNFVSADIDPGANVDNFIVRKYDAPNWSGPATGARTATSTEATGITSFSDFAVGELQVDLAFAFTPSTLNLKSSGLWVTAYLEPADPYAASQIDIGSIRLNGSVPVDADAPTELGDHDGNGKPDLMVKFNRAAVELTLTDGNAVPVTVTGTVDGQFFMGIDYIRVLRAVVSAPSAGTSVPSGGSTTVSWQTPNGIQVQSVAVLYSLDGGDSWELVERGLANTGSYLWTLTDTPPSDRAKVAIVLVESSDETGFIVDGALGVSEEFTITTPVGVGNRPAVLALRGVTPNPATQHLRVSFSLKGTNPATLALYDISGRQISSRRVDGLGAGWHTVDLAQTGLSAGVYMIRLTQDGMSLSRRAAFVR
ncbi:MAG TPA: T9SS type A sorting domain-containing protein [Candidatus Eisenbacteria bacterium]|nr:T9SS type A sorting domain-containing protein [Candidatus Eisenbacteria bacterium]